MIELIICFVLIVVCMLFIYTAEFITEDTEGEGVTLRYILRVIPHIPRNIWNTLWIRGDEFHKSMNIDAELFHVLSKKDQKTYIKDLERRRKLAHNKTLNSEENL